MKKLFKFKYSKLFLLLISIILAYIIFSQESIQNYLSNIGNLGYLGIFIAGLLFSFGFTTPFAIALFITIPVQNIMSFAIIAGFAAMLSDLFIFRLIKISFMDEFNELQKTSSFKTISDLIKSNIKLKIRNYLLFFLAGIIIASPLPDELGITMLAGLTHIKTRILMLISFICNTFGILIILFAASL